MSAKIDPAVAALTWALEQHPELDDGGSVLCLRPRSGLGLERFRGRLTVAHDFKPAVERLEDSGLPVVSIESLPSDQDMVVVMPDRQREQSLADIARAFASVKEGGLVIFSVPNDWGAGRLEEHFEKALSSIHTVSKHKCRVFWGTKSPQLNQALLAEWMAHATFTPQAMATPLLADSSEPALHFLTRPGLFSWQEPDEGSLFLIKHLPSTLRGRGADVGSGWGLLAAAVLARCPAVTHLDLYEADRAAISASQRNLAAAKNALGSPEKWPQLAFHWNDVTQGLKGELDWVVMNPPFHQDRAADPMLGIRFIAAAVQALKPGGQLWLVANRNLPYERFLRDGLPNAHVVAQEASFKVLTGTRTIDPLGQSGLKDDVDLDHVPDGPRPHGHSPEATGHRPRKGKHKRQFFSRR